MKRVVLSAWFWLLIAGCATPGAVADPPQLEGFPPGYASNASDFEKEILADGVVSYAEYERANLTIVECLEDAGIAVTQVVPASEEGFLNFNFVRTDDPGGARRVDAAYADCEKQYAQYVFAVYRKQNLPTGVELTERKADLVACLEGAGLSDVSADPTTTELAERFFIHGDNLTEAQVDCFFRYETVLHAEE